MFESPIHVIDAPRERIVADRVGSARYPLDVLESETLRYYWRLAEEDPTDAVGEAETADATGMGGSLGVTYIGTTGVVGTANVDRVMGAIEGPLLDGGDYRRHVYVDASQGGYVTIGNAGAWTGYAFGVWVKPAELGTGARRRVIAANWTTGENTAGSKAGWWVELNASDEWVLKYAKTGVADTGPSYAYSTITGPEATGEWQFIVVRWMGTGVLAELEVDGVSAGTDTGTGISAGGDIRLGGSHASDTTPFPLAEAFAGYYAEAEIHVPIGGGTLVGVLDGAARVARAAARITTDAIRCYVLEASSDVPLRRTNDPEQGRDGARVGDGYGDARVVTLTGMLDADTWPEKNVERVRILGAANELMRQTGVMRWRPAGFDTCQMRVKRHEEARIAAQASSSGMLLSWIAEDPRVYSAEQHGYYDEGTDAIGTSFEIVNAGNRDTPPRFIVYGPLDDLELENLTTGQTLSLTANGGLSVAVSHYVEVDHAQPDPIVHYDSDPTDSRYLNVDSSVSDFWELVPGTNEIVVNGTGATASTRVFVFWRDAWMP